MDLIIKITLLPIGKPEDRVFSSQVESLIKMLPARFQTNLNSPVISETDILNSVHDILLEEPDFLLIPVMHGGTVRSIVLAASKANIPTALWCHDINHSLASAALALESLRQLDIRCIILHGRDEIVLKELQIAAAAASAIKKLSQSRIGRLGYPHFNLLNSEISSLAVNKRFGSWIVPMAFDLITDTIDEIKNQELSELISVLKEKFPIRADDDLLKKAASFHLALKKICSGQKLDIVAIDCWNRIIFNYPPCLGFLEDNYSVSCEGDVILALLIIAGEALTGNPGFTGDIYSLDEETGEVILMHCGGHFKLNSSAGKTEVVEQMPPEASGIKKTVLACHPILSPGKGTLVLLHGSNIDQLHLRECEVIGTDFSSQMRVKIKIKKDIGIFRKEIAGNHYTIFQGDFIEHFRLWAGWMNMTVH